MNNCSFSVAPIVKGDTFSLEQNSKNNLESKQIKNVSYTFIVGSLVYAQVCKKPHIAYTIGILSRY